MTYTYKTKGTCSTNIELEVEDGIVRNIAWARMDATAIDLLTCIKTMRQEEVEKMLKEGFSKENMVLSVVK